MLGEVLIQLTALPTNQQTLLNRYNINTFGTYSYPPTLRSKVYGVLEKSLFPFIVFLPVFHAVDIRGVWGGVRNPDYLSRLTPPCPSTLLPPGHTLESTGLQQTATAAPKKV